MPKTKMTAGRPSGGKSQTLAALKGEEKVRLNADIPKGLYKQVKIRALEDEQTITDLVKAAISEYLSK